MLGPCSHLSHYTIDIAEKVEEYLSLFMNNGMKVMFCIAISYLVRVSGLHKS